MRIWPTADDFSQGSPKFDTTGLLDWIRAVPWQTDAAYGSGGTGYALGSSGWLATARLYSGWFGQLPGPGYNNPNPAAVSAMNALGGGGGPCAWLPRHYTALDVFVEASHQLQSPSLAFVAANARREFFGVGARLSGATLTSGGTSATYHLGGSGYWLCALFDPFISGSAGKWMLLRVNAGTVTRLDDSPQGSSSFSAWSVFAFHRTRRLRLEVFEDAGGTRVQGWISPAGRGTADMLLFDYLDSSGSRISTAGRVGFFASAENTTSGVQAADCCNFLMAGAHGGAPDLLEDWSRAALAHAASLPQNPSFFSGFDLASGWAGDAWSAGAVQGFLREDDGANRLSVNGLSGARSGTYLRQRAADSATDQQRQVVVRFSSSGSAVGMRSAGPAVRVSQPSAGAAPSSCYQLLYRMDDLGSTAALELWRYSSGSGVLLASKAVAYSQDSDLLPSLKVWNAPDPLLGNVFLQAFLAGVQVQLLAPAGGFPLGVSADAAGTVQDTSSARVLSGPGEALVLECPASTARALVLDSWAAGGGSGSSDDEAAQPSLGWSSEAAGATGTLVLAASAEAEEQLGLRSIEHRLDLDDTYSSPLELSGRRRWLVPAKLDQGEYDAFMAFWAAHWDAVSGRGVPFTWQPPARTGTALVAFTGQLERTFVPPSAWLLRVGLEERRP